MCILFIVGKAEHLSVCLLAIYVLSFEGLTSTRIEDKQASFHGNSGSDKGASPTLTQKN